MVCQPSIFDALRRAVPLSSHYPVVLWHLRPAASAGRRFAMKVVTPAKETAEFAKHLTTDSYRKQERDYKVAIHRVLAALLSEEKRGRADFPSLISNVFK